jgi:uncharacterized glyoxalase superfamily protein PhnB
MAKWDNKRRKVEGLPGSMAAAVNQAGGVGNRSMPPGRIIPELVYADLEVAVAWLCQAFGFSERLRIGNHRSQLVLGGESVIAVGDPSRAGSGTDASGEAGGASHSIMARVEDVEEYYERAVRVGARIISPVQEYPYGERQFTVEDVGGHIWTFTQSIRDVDPRDWGGVVPGEMGQ